MVRSTERHGPLSRYRVIDLTDATGAMCGRILGELGADVIKVEKPGGSAERRIGPYFRDIHDPEKSLLWFAFNHSKRGITLDMEHVKGKETLKRLILGAHFVIESFPPGYMDDIGLGYEALSETNRGLIVTSITPFGQTGPYRDFKGADIVAMAMGGSMHICGYPDRPPLRWSMDLSWPQAGVQAAMVSMIAHHHRLVSGQGQHIDISIRDCIVWGAYASPQSWAMLGSILGRTGFNIVRGHLKIRLNHRCRDGYVAWMPWRGQASKSLAEYMKEEGVSNSFTGTDWDQLDVEAMSQEQLEQWQDDLEKFCLGHTKAELHEEAIKRGIMLWPMNDIKDLLDMPQLKARAFWVDVEHDELCDVVTYPGVPVRGSEDYWHVRRRAPLIGEHNSEIYVDELGFSSSELRDMQQEGAI